MKNKILKIVALISLLSSFGWMLSDVNWERVATFLGVLASLIGLEIYEDKTRAKFSDIRLYEDFIHSLPSNGTIRYLRDISMNQNVDPSIFSNLDSFVEAWDNAEHEFIDRKLEKKRKEFMNCVSVLSNYFADNTHPTRNDRQRVPLTIRENNPERYKEMVDKLNSLTDAAIKSHQDLIRLGKQKLKG